MNYKCPKCGSNINNTNFCPVCGNKLTNDNNNVDYLLIGVILLIFFPFIGIIFCILMWNRDQRLKKALKWYFICVGAFIVLVFGLVLLFINMAKDIPTDDKSYSFRCNSFCNSSYTIEGNTCICKDGRTYNFENDSYTDNDIDNSNDNNYEDDYDYDDDLDNSNDVNISFNRDKWLNDTSSNKYVITVIGYTTCPHCSNYKPVIENVSLNKKMKLYFVYGDKMDSRDYAVLLKTYNINEFEGSVPFTFVTYNGKVIRQHTGSMNESETLNFLDNLEQYM